MCCVRGILRAKAGDIQAHAHARAAVTDHVDEDRQHTLWLVRTSAVESRQTPSSRAGGDALGNPLQSHPAPSTRRAQRVAVLTNVAHHAVCRLCVTRRYGAIAVVDESRGGRVLRIMSPSETASLVRQAGDELCRQGNSTAQAGAGTGFLPGNGAVAARGGSRRRLRPPAVPEGASRNAATRFATPWTAARRRHAAAAGRERSVWMFPAGSSSSSAASRRATSPLPQRWNDEAGSTRLSCFLPGCGSPSHGWNGLSPRGWQGGSQGHELLLARCWLRRFCARASRAPAAARPA